jgi:hypothetical protein
VNHVEAVAELPITYAVALRLREAGATDGLIAAALDIEADAVESVLDLADAKLAALLARRPEAFRAGP